MKEQATICVAYTGAAVNDGIMNADELAPALIALGKFIDEANDILNNDNSRIEVRVSAHFELGSFEMIFELGQTPAQELKLFFADTSYSLNDILCASGVVATLRVCNLLELYRRLKGKQPSKAEKIDEGTVRVFFEEETRDISIEVWRLFKSERIKKHVAGIVQPLKKNGVDAVEFRDAANKTVAERISADEAEYFLAPAQGEKLQERVSRQELMLKIVSASFERGLKWRFDDGDSKFYAEVKDENFLSAVEVGRIAFGSGDVLIAEVETVQQHVGGELRKTTKSILKVLQINRRAEQINFSNEP